MHSSCSTDSVNHVHITHIEETGHCHAVASKGSTVKRKTYGYLLNGKMFLDGKVVETTIGDGNSLIGVEKGLLGLCKGDHMSMVLHSDFAYGTKGLEDLVPINATLIMDMWV